MRIMPDADSVVARKKAKYALEKLYRIDSTFVLKRGKDLEDLIRANLPALVVSDGED